MKKNKITVVFILAVFMFSTFALTGMLANPAGAKSDSTTVVKNVAIVFSTGGLGDKSFNDAGFEGAKRANDTSKVNIDYVEPTTVDEINNFIEQYATSTAPSYDLIIAIGFSSADGVNASSLAHTDKKFAIIDMVVDNPNVANIVFKEHEGSFLAGAMAAMVTKTNVLGFLGGLDIPLINKFRAGYEQGAKYINSSITVLAQYSPDANNPWGDIAGGKTVANSFIDKNADVIYAAAGGTGIGVFDAADEAKADGKIIYGIGVDSDQDYLKEGVVLTSMIKRVDVAVENLINDVIDGTTTPAFQSLGLKENGVGISNMTYTTNLKNGVYENGTSTLTRWQIVQAIRDDIIAGNIVVEETVAVSAPSPGFELALVFFGLMALPVIRRKLK